MTDDNDPMRNMKRPSFVFGHRFNADPMRTIGYSPIYPTWAGAWRITPLLPVANRPSRIPKVPRKSAGPSPIGELTQ